MKKIFLTFIIVLLVLPNVIAPFGGGSPGSASSSGAVSSGGKTLGLQGEVKVVLGKGDYIRFDAFGQKHTLKITDVDDSYIWISILPIGIIQKINVGTTRRFDLNNNGLEDFLIKFQRSTGYGKVILVYSIIKEGIVKPEITSEVVRESESIRQEIKQLAKGEITPEEVNKPEYIVIPLIVIALLIFGVYWYKENWDISKGKDKNQGKLKLK